VVGCQGGSEGVTCIVSLLDVYMVRFNVPASALPWQRAVPSVSRGQPRLGRASWRYPCIRGCGEQGALGLLTSMVGNRALQIK
jgi:hypothetical protein